MSLVTGQLTFSAIYMLSIYDIYKLQAVFFQAFTSVSLMIVSILRPILPCGASCSCTKPWQFPCNTSYMAKELNLHTYIMPNNDEIR